jgi:hypothetical protein
LWEVVPAREKRVVKRTAAAAARKKKLWAPLYGVYLTANKK